MDEEPGIRTNTTICLGKISKYLNDSTKKKVLVPAFTRTLRDPFPHARVASLMALAATSEYYDATDCATKLLPCVSLVLVDKERPVRTQAFKTAETFIKRLEKLTESMPDTAIPDPNSTENSSSLAVAGSVAGAAASVAESWAGWAVTSITKKIAGSGMEGEITAPTSVTVDAPSTPTKDKMGSEHLSPSLSTKNAFLVDQADPDTSNGWENEDHLVTVDNLTKNDWAHLTDGWDLDDSDWGNGDGWDNNWNSSRPLSTASSKSTSSIHKSPTTSNVLSKEEKAVELNKKREERKQRMAELREQKKKSNGLGAKKI
ncbi:14725_t:CDS:2 [Funneliformis mosseae]|uniref:14725_t:CDS:1 n=1 Tax=Funneliformis mosseae TaxID=27381 RepID=A0A9N9BVF2_FUNMO|nr:14725_t:CDS:2 [Funneliformis mosseae]